MFRDALTLVTLGVALGGGLLNPSLRAEPVKRPPKAANNDPVNLQAQVQDLHPFTRIAYIPAGSDLSTIRFESARTIEVPTKVTYTTDTNYCAEVALFRDPGGSMECPRRRPGALATAYEIIYSYRGRELASDEYGLGYSLFQVYFRPDQLVAALRNVLANRKFSRSEKASYFRITASREQAQQFVIDEEKSTFCDTVVLDGEWISAAPNCRETIKYKLITAPADYIAVRVDPVQVP